MQTSVNVILNQKDPEIYSVSADDSILDAVREMRSAGVGAVVVLEEDELVGIYTERDLLNSLEEYKEHLEETPMSEVMTKDLSTVSPDATVAEAMQLMTEYRFRHLPIMDGNQLVGLISIGDCTRWVLERQESDIEELVHYINT